MKHQLDQRLIAACCCGRYEQAFNEALSAEDVDIVIWLCTHLDPAEVLSRQPAKLSQTIILALIQQLGQDLQQVRPPPKKLIRHQASFMEPASLRTLPTLAKRLN